MSICFMIFIFFCLWKNMISLVRYVMMMTVNKCLQKRSENWKRASSKKKPELQNAKAEKKWFLSISPLLHFPLCFDRLLNIFDLFSVCIFYLFDVHFFYPNWMEKRTKKNVYFDIALQFSSQTFRSNDMKHEWFNDLQSKKPFQF